MPLSPQTRERCRRFATRLDAAFGLAKVAVVDWISFFHLETLQDIRLVTLTQAEVLGIHTTL